MNRQLLGSHRERPARSADIDRLRMGRTLLARPRRYYTFLFIYVSVFFYGDYPPSLPCSPRTPKGTQNPSGCRDVFCLTHDRLFARVP